MKLDHPLKFLPSPNRSRKHRAVLMLSDEKYSALEGPRGCIGKSRSSDPITSWFIRK